MKKNLFNLFSLFILFGAAALPGSAQVSQHALAKVASVAVAPVVHPKRTVKEIAGSVVFAGEEVVDVVHLGLDGLDKSFSALDPNNQYFGLLYQVIDKADGLAAKADSGLESAEQYFFGSSN